jgi:hypothetical protein
MTPCHVSYAISSFMTQSLVDEFPVYLSLDTISPPKVVTQLSKPNKDLSLGSILRGLNLLDLLGLP